MRKHHETHVEESTRLSNQVAQADHAARMATVDDLAVIRSSSITAKAPTDAEIEAATPKPMKVGPAKAVLAPRAPVSLADVQRWVVAGVKNANDLSIAKAAAITRAVTEEIAARWPSA